MSRPERPQSTNASPEFWPAVRAGVEAALDLPLDSRRDFLDRTYADNTALRARIEALLHACERAAEPNADFLAASASTFAAPLLRDWQAESAAEPGSAQPADAPSRAGSAEMMTLGAALSDRYEIERELAHGGTATVYLARDARHGRHVAIKVLDPALGIALSAQRFLQEIRVTAGLAHPHVLPLHDSGEAAGRLYYIMPFIEGETLRDRIAREGALPAGDVVRILNDVTDALAHAHDRGIVHRDIKPANILLADGHALVADFGIARAVQRARELPAMDGSAAAAMSPARGQASLTLTGTSPGTPAYMAPEQARGMSDVDHRADLYALGVVAYEALTGAHPFAGRSRAAMLAAHLDEIPPRIDGAAGVPPALVSLVQELLAKDPAARPPSAREVMHALRSIPVVDAGVATPRAPPASAPAGLATSRRRKARTVAVAAVMLMAAGFVGYAVRLRTGADPPGAGTELLPGAIRTLAVLPFETTGTDAGDEFFGDGMTDELAHALARLPTLRIAGRTSSYAFRGRQIPAQQIGRALKVDALVVGSIRRAGVRLRLSTQLVSTADGSVVWDSVFESGTGDVFAVQDELTRSIVAALAPALRGQVDVRVLAERGTTDPLAYEFFLNGNYHFLLRGPDNVQRAVGLFRQAIARDPNFARAHAGLALAYRVLPIYNALPADSVSALVDASARRAVALDSTLGAAHMAMGNALEIQLRFRDASEAYRTGVALDPVSASAHLAYGFSLLNLGRHDEALTMLNRALQLDPALKSAASALAFGYLVTRRHDEALDAARAAMALDSAFPLAIFVQGQAQIFGGQPDSAVVSQERGVRLHPRDTRLLSNLLLAYAATGRRVDAQRIRARLHSTPDAALIDGTEAARADLVFGDPEPLVRLLTSRDGLRRFVQAGGVIGCNPVLDPLWADARFRTAMQRLAIEPCPLARRMPLPRG